MICIRKFNEQELLDICESASKEFDSFTKEEGLQLVKQIENCANQIESLIKKADKMPFSIGCDVKENFCSFIRGI